MRILFVHEVNYDLKPIYEVQEFAEYLALRGHEVTFLHYSEGSASKVNLRNGRGRRLGLGPGVELHALPEILPGILGRLFAAVAAVFWIPYMLRKTSPDVVVNYAVPTFGWQAVLAANSMRIPILYRAIDLPDKIRKTVFSSLVKLAERVVVKRSDWVTSNNPALLSHCISIGACPNRSSVNLPYVDFASYQRGSRNEGRKLLGLQEDDKAVVFLGSFFEFCGLDLVVERFRKNQVSGVKLVLVGAGHLERKLRNLVTEAKMHDRVIFAGFVPFHNVPAVLAAADVLINPMLPSQVAHLALPNKLIQYLASSKPTVSTALEGAKNVLSEFGGISWVDDPHKCMDVAIELLQHKHGEPASAWVVASERFGNATILGFESLIMKVAGR